MGTRPRLGLRPTTPHQAAGRRIEAARRQGAFRSAEDLCHRAELNRKESIERMIGVIRMSDIIAPTLAEGRQITGKQSVGDVLRALHELGPSVVPLTMDKNGGAVSADGMVALCDGIDVPVVDPTGAGDTFAAALVVALQRGMSLADTALFCNCAGTLVVTKRGVIGQAIPTLAEVNALMQTKPCKVSLVALSELE